MVIVCVGALVCFDDVIVQEHHGHFDSQCLIINSIL